MEKVDACPPISRENRWVRCTRFAMDIWAWAWWNSDRGYESDTLHAVSESRPSMKGVCHLSKRHRYWLDNVLQNGWFLSNFISCKQDWNTAGRKGFLPPRKTICTGWRKKGSDAMAEVIHSSASENKLVHQVPRRAFLVCLDGPSLPHASLAHHRTGHCAQQHAELDCMTWQK